VEAIEGDWDGIADSSIDAAISEAKGYLSNYDIAAIFAAVGAARNAILLLYIKDIAVWHFIQLANPNIDLELREKRYNRAIEWLEDVQAGKVVPPLPTIAPTETNPQPGKLKFGSNPRRTTQY
jgi:phage gp36-like protein